MMAPKQRLPSWQDHGQQAHFLPEGARCGVCQGRGELYKRPGKYEPKEWLPCGVCRGTGRIDMTPCTGCSRDVHPEELCGHDDHPGGPLCTHRVGVTNSSGIYLTEMAGSCCGREHLGVCETCQGDGKVYTGGEFPGDLWPYAQCGPCGGWGVRRPLDPDTGLPTGEWRVLEP